MPTEVNYLLLAEANVVLILEQVDLLRVVHDEHALHAPFLLHIVLNTLTVRLKNCQLAARELVDFMLRDLVWFRRVELDLEQLIHVA